MLKIIKNIYIAMLILFVVGACSHDEFVEAPQTQDEIVFAATSGKVTRADISPLVNYIDNFRIYGTDTKDGRSELVFNNYVLWYDENVSQSNTSFWEYVGYDPVDNKLQTIKYWDFSAFPYTFWAIAGADKGSFTQKDELGRISSFETYMSETAADFPILFYTKPTVIEKHQYTDPVTFQFLGAHSRVRFAFYETVPGYAVKDVKFHIGSGSTQYTECVVNGKFNMSGTLTLGYDYSELAIVSAPPPSKEVYKQLAKRAKEQHPKLMDESDDCYLVYTLGEGDTHGHVLCYNVFRPTRPVPAKIAAKLKAKLEEMKTCTSRCQTILV